MKKLLSLLLSLLIVFTGCSLLACDGNTVPEENVNDKKFVLNDFETPQKFGQVRVMNWFGVVSKNDDAEFVKKGNSSAKLQPIGSQSNGSLPYFYISTISKTYGYDHSDFSKVECILFSVYNSQDTDKSMVLGAVTKIKGMSDVTRAPIKTFVFKPGWNDISFVLDHAYNTAMIGTEIFEGLYFEFDNSGSREVADAPVYYLDELTLTFGEGAGTGDSKLELDENEVCNFEKIYQRFIFGVSYPTLAVAPEISVIAAASEGMIAPSGKNILKVISKPMNLNDWPGIVLPGVLLKASEFNKMPAETREGYDFCFDVFSVDTNHLVYPRFYSGDSPEKNSTLYSVNAIKGQWTTFRQNLADIPSEIFANPGGMRITWTELTIKTNITFYFDNFRLEKIN